MTRFAVLVMSDPGASGTTMVQTAQIVRSADGVNWQACSSVFPGAPAELHDVVADLNAGEANEAANAAFRRELGQAS